MILVYDQLEPTGNPLIDLADKVAYNPKLYIAVQVLEVYGSGDAKNPITVSFRYAGAAEIMTNSLINSLCRDKLEAGKSYVLRIQWVQVGRKRMKQWFHIVYEGDYDVVCEIGRPLRAWWHENIQRNFGPSRS